jgi:hypothetical protein
VHPLVARRRTHQGEQGRPRADPRGQAQRRARGLGRLDAADPGEQVVVALAAPVARHGATAALEQSVEDHREEVVDHGRRPAPQQPVLELGVGLPEAGNRNLRNLRLFHAGLPTDREVELREPLAQPIELLLGPGA